MPRLLGAMMARKPWTQSQRKTRWKGKTPRDLWSQPDEDQNDSTQPHCCGVCQDSPIGDQGQGLI